MQLLVVNPLSYISPNSFQQWKSCSMKLYLLRLAGYPFIPFKQNYAMGLGTLVDMHIKAYIADKKGIKQANLDFATAAGTILWADDIDVPELNKLALILADAYTKSSMMAQILDCNDLLLERKLYQIRGGVPVLGIPDIVANGIPIDIKVRGFWKVSGARNRTTISPTPGYIDRWHVTIEKQTRVGPHSDRLRLEATNEVWATAQVFYHWLVNPAIQFGEGMETVGKGKKAKTSQIVHDQVSCAVSEIHEITSSGIDPLSFDISYHRTQFSTVFADQVWKEVQQMWEIVNTRLCEIPQPLPSPRMCLAYGQLCDVACKCEAYKIVANDPELGVF